jgi:hypothetical protein
MIRAQIVVVVRGTPASLEAFRRPITVGEEPMVRFFALCVWLKISGA